MITPVRAPRVLYHYTCIDHGYPGISRDRLIIPRLHPFLRTKLVWLTDLDIPDRHALGLTAGWIPCDRTAVRVDVETTRDVIRWGAWAHHAQPSRALRNAFEADALPAHWWVSALPVDVLTVHPPQHRIGSVTP